MLWKNKTDSHGVCIIITSSGVSKSQKKIQQMKVVSTPQKWVVSHWGSSPQKGGKKKTMKPFTLTIQQWCLILSWYQGKHHDLMAFSLSFGITWFLALETTPWGQPLDVQLWYHWGNPDNWTKLDGENWNSFLVPMLILLTQWLYGRNQWTTGKETRWYPWQLCVFVEIRRSPATRNRDERPMRLSGT